MGDPYRDLAARFAGRKRDYLRRLQTDRATFEKNPLENSVGKRRGFLRFDADQKRPAATRAKQRAAVKAVSANLACWTDSPAYRSIDDEVREPWLYENINYTIARLLSLPSGASFAVPFPAAANLAPDQRLDTRSVLRVSSAIGIWGVRPLVDKVGDELGGSLPGDLIDRILDSLAAESFTRDPRPPEADDLIASLSPLAVAHTDTDGNTSLRGPVGDATEILTSLLAFLPAALVIEIVHAVVAQTTSVAGPTPGSGDPGDGSQPAPQVAAIDDSVAAALDRLVFLGQLEEAPLAESLAEVADWLWPVGAPTSVRGPEPLMQQLFARRLPWPADGALPFEWPPFDATGVYWWRAVYRAHCVAMINLDDTADFGANHLLRFVNLVDLFGSNPRQVPSYVASWIKYALMVFKYWLDEAPTGKGSREEMTFWSENHQAMFAAVELLAGQLFKDETFARSGKKGSDHVKHATARATRWLDDRLRFGFSEWNAPGYYNEDIPPLVNLADFAEAPELRTKAAMVLDIVLFDLARFTCRGSFAPTAGRCYWEHKNYGWEQSVGETVELLFHTRGDYVGCEDTAVAIASAVHYEVPEAILAIGLDRALVDRQQNFVDRTRVSITFDEAADRGITVGDASHEDDLVFWYGLGAYYDHNLEATKAFVESHDQLRYTQPFKLLYSIGDKSWKEWLTANISLISDVADIATGAAGTALSAVLPPPWSFMAWWSNAERLFESVIHLFTDLWNVFRSTVLWIFGDDKPEIPDSTVQRLLEAMLIEFNKGTVLSRANMVTFNNGDAMLSSVQMHRVGMVAFQKHPWAASLGLDACVWTTARWMAPTLESWKQSIIDFFVGLGSFHGSEAAASALAPLGTALGGGKDIFGHDGPNYWTGSLALPMIVQHENAAIIAYNVPAKQREFSGTQTHAWFPKDRFDETRKQDASDGTWFFGRKDTIDVDTAKKVGSGYVALFSAHRCDWTNEDGNAWNGKEILASGGSNIYVCMVGNEAEFGTFDVFVQKILAAHLNISGVGSANGLECTFDVPDKGRLELFYDDAKGRFDGEDLAVDEFPRFENRYVRSSRDGEVDWQSRKYQFVHSPTGLTVTHDLDRLDRVLTRQSDPGPKKRAGQRRLLDGSLTPVRRTSR